MNISKNDKKLIALSGLSLGQKALIVAFSFDVDGGKRVEKMGLFPGERLEIMRLPSQGGGC